MHNGCYGLDEGLQEGERWGRMEKGKAELALERRSDGFLVNHFPT